MSSVGRIMYCAYTSDAEEILTFKTFKNPVACETENN
jgi:hypothetical protein